MVGTTPIRGSRNDDVAGPSSKSASMRHHCILRMRRYPSVAGQNVSRGPAAGLATANRRA
jgi:hypothetical protein